jgi:hypothetical protein
MKNIFSEKNEVLMESIDLPRDYGETRASESMQPLNDAIYDIIHKDDEFSQEFIEKIERMEKEDSKPIKVDELDELFL